MARRKSLDENWQDHVANALADSGTAENPQALLESWIRLRHPSPEIETRRLAA